MVRPPRVPLSWLVLGLVVSLPAAAAPKPARDVNVPAIQVGTPVFAVGSGVVNVRDAEHAERLRSQLLTGPPPVRPLIPSEMNEEEDEIEPGADFIISPESMIAPRGVVPLVASPSPTSGFIGLDDIPMVDSSFIIIPPDVNGAVGPTHIFQNLNNNVRILTKSGSVESTVGVNTFWAPTGASPNNFTDPRSVFDPYNGRFITIMQGDLDNSTGNSLVIGLSDTNNPNGTWHLYRTILYMNPTNALYDYPTLGFNKNWVTIAINRYNNAGVSQGNTVLAIYYPDLRANTFTAYRFDRGDFCAAPCQTYSAVTDTEYVPIHLSSSSGSYRLDMITGSGPGAPTYVAGTTRVRSGGGWTQPSGQILPQSAPVSGTSSCGATPCKIEVADAQIRSPAVFRGGSIWYAQTVGIPAGTLTHTAAQWSKITTPTGIFADGGRVEDPTATATNGGKWYSHAHIGVNLNGDFMVGFSQFSSAQHPAAGYAVHLASDAASTIRDPVITRVGDDYYHKDFGSSRNRWGDFSTVQVDPTDDMTFWAVDEYAKLRVGTNDGTTGSNSSKWSTWWASLAPPTVSIDAGPSLNEGNSGTTTFPFTARLSYAYGLPIQVSFHTSDGTATTANSDYQALTSSVTIPAGSTTATINILVNGDTQCETDETFNVVLDGANNNLLLGSPASATGTILNDETKTITATAGSGGTISPPGATPLTCGANQTYTIAPNDCFAILDVKVDGVSVGAVTSYPFTGVTADHTIAATFSALGPYTITASAGTGGTISPNGGTSVACGGSQGYTIAPDNCHTILDVKLDGVSVGAVASYTVSNVHASHTLAATFASTNFALSSTHVEESCTGVGDGSVDLTVSGGTGPFTYSWSNGPTTQDISGLAAGIYTVTVTDAPGCVAVLSDTIPVHAYTITASAGPNGQISPNGAGSVNCGTSATYTFTPDGGYVVDQLTVDSSPVAPGPNYTFTNVTADHTIHVTFKSSQTAVELPRPTDLELRCISANPATDLVQLQYALPVAASMRLSILDVQGRELAVLEEGSMPDGWHTATWRGQTEHGHAPSGLYFARLRVGERSLIRRFVMTR